ncbi:ABC multidrug transporter [Colletotrichum chrysophilum]|uniref:ABC multidrug transporter n=1 Tax=Colletotrichum chrysophilum TaxID=1836956 RepID=A0AAD9AAT4_9PEZI|nr:ABC multidrug transporter [Colletotrichum chrysophilum]
MANSSACADSEFGPIHGCRGDFDFSLLFEQTIFSAVPSGLFLLLAATRLWVLFTRQKKSQRVVVGTWLRWAKLSAVACYGAIEVALLVSWINAHSGLYGTRASITAAILKLVDVFALGILSWLEHSYSPRPSTLLNVYLLVSLSFDAVQTRTLWLKANDEGTSVLLIPAEFTAALLIKSGLLVLEAIEKRSLLLPEWRHKTPEETAGVFSRSLLIWLRGILLKGRKTLLAPTDLDPLSEGLGTAHLSRVFGTIWNKQNRRPAGLPLVLAKALRWSIMAPVMPRLAQVAFTLCQPLLLRKFLRYLAGEATFVGNTGYAFIITYGLVYLGIAISGCIYWRLTYKSLVKLRGCILAAVYEKTLAVDPARCDTTAAVPLVSTDMERIIAGFKDVHELWANTVQVAISVWLLYRELGIACVAPAVVATQERVAITARAVAGMKSIKLLGLSGSVSVVQPEDSSLAEPRSAVVIRAGELGWSETKPVLTNVNINIPASQLTVIIGPVASGKSTLARVMISELPYFRGNLQIFDSVRESANTGIAFCGQEPFIMYGTLLDNITGFSSFDSTWLESVVHAVDLENDIAALPKGRDTNVGSKGTRLSGGQQQRVAIARALYARKQIAIFDDVLSGLDATTKVKVFERTMGPQGLLRQSGCTVVLCTHDVSLLPRTDHIIVLGLDGRVAEAGTYEQLREQSSYIKSLVIQEKSSASGDVLREGTRDEAGRDGHEAHQPLAAGNDDLSSDEPADDLTRRLGDASIYEYLASHIGFWRVVVFVALTCGWAVFSTIGTVWLNFWSSAVSTLSPHGVQNGYYLGVYAAFQVLALAFLALFSGFSLTTLAVKAGTSLHHVLLKAMIWAPQSFFSAVDTGITTNRFSQDIILVDGDFPMSLLETLSAGLVAVVQMILIAVAAPYVAIAYPFLLTALYFVQSFYLKTSRQLRFLDLEARSPLQTNLLETVQGLATIRAFGWPAQSIEANHDLVDASQKPVYLLYMVQRWLQLVLELIIATVAILVAAIAPKMSATLGGLLGVALIQLMSLSQELKMIVINYTNLETSLTAISRIKAFEKETPSESHPSGDIAVYETPRPGWPQEGSVSFDAATVSYVPPGTENASFALRDFTLHITSGQKVAICGRSGSGKSTLIAALTRMAELASGSIHIDAVDIGSVHPSDVRSAINTIPQEPFFFHATVARNLDPSGVLSDEALRLAVEKVQMWQVIEDAGGLHAAATLDNLSQGQKQLLALSRAILNPSNVVLMDEATSSVDQHTASMMKQTIQDEFKDITVIAVAHQLSTIMDFDVVVVMESGYIAETGSPANLLKTKSLFRDLWDSQ